MSCATFQVSTLYHDPIYGPGNNEIKVILSSNMDVDIAYQDNLISDTVLIQFPEYTFSEARSRAGGFFYLSDPCDPSDPNAPKPKLNGAIHIVSTFFLWGLTLLLLPHGIPRLGVCRLG